MSLKKMFIIGRLITLADRASFNMRQNGIFAPVMQLVVRLLMFVCYVAYYIAIPEEKRIFTASLVVPVASVYALYHVFLYFIAAHKPEYILNIARYANWMDIGMSHLAWLSDPSQPSAMLAFIVFSVIFNGMQRGIEVYRNNSIISLLCTSMTLVLRSLIFGISSAELFLSGLLLVMLVYAYVLIVRIEKLKQRDKAREEELRSAHSDLEVHRNMLEELVRVRTSDLLKTNMNLMKEIKIRKQAEREARQKQAQLLQAAKMASLGSLVAGLAHEIGNPMALIQANLSILKKFINASFPLLDQIFKDRPDTMMCNIRYFELKERMSEAFEGLDDGTKRVSRLVTDLRIYARQQPVVYSDYFSIEEAVSKAFGLTRSLIEKSTSNFYIEMEEEIPKVRGDLLKIEQVLINLITNACQALTDYGQSIVVKAGISLDLNHVNIEVTDKGRGMTKAVMEKIRDPFFTTRRHKDGTGLGLSISDSIIKEHGGQIEFYSEPGEGTTARIVLPLVAESAASLTSQTGRKND